MKILSRGVKRKVFMFSVFPIGLSRVAPGAPLLAYILSTLGALTLKGSILKVMNAESL